VKYWVFNEEQRDRAIEAFVERLKRDKTLVHNDSTAAKLGEAIKIFLDSPEARAHKLQGGASYGPQTER
jgi:hypothetical protein